MQLWSWVHDVLILAIKIVPGLLDGTYQDCLCVQVLEQLPHGLAIEVVRSSDLVLHSKLERLPENLRPLAAHANVPGCFLSAVQPAVPQAAVL